MSGSRCRWNANSPGREGQRYDVWAIHWLHLANTNVFRVIYFELCANNLFWLVIAPAYIVSGKVMNRRRASLTLLNTTRFLLFSTLIQYNTKFVKRHVAVASEALVLNYWQSKTFTSRPKQRRASAIPATCHILAHPLPGTKMERNQEETGENVGNEKIGKVREMGGNERRRGT